jgi:16S rRNA (cytosine1402-N4)-methyltransferase
VILLHHLFNQLRPSGILDIDANIKIIYGYTGHIFPFFPLLLLYLFDYIVARNFFILLQDIFILHISVLQEPILQFFRDKKLKIFVDATLGAAGHSLALCSEHPELELLVGFDQDSSALQLAGEKLQGISPRRCLIHSNFCHIKEKLAEAGISQIDGALFDLGISSMQIDIADRGFSFQQEGPLDMRMDSESYLTAEEIVNSYAERELAQIFFELGEERHSRRAAKAIVEARRKGRIDTTAKLVEVLSSAIPTSGGIHRATRVFQALRIAVNDELNVIREALPQAVSMLAPGGILCVISFHSLEDRIVKHLFRDLAKADPDLEILTKKPIEPSYEECRKNRRARSAKLRVLQRRQ